MIETPQPEKPLQGLPPGVSPLPGVRGPARVGGSIDRLRSRWGVAPVEAITTVVDAWPMLVGADIARHCRPLTLRGGVLRVESDDAAVVEYLRHSCADLVRATRRHLELDELHSVQVELVRH